MNTMQKVAETFGNILAQDMINRGEIGWTAERLADTKLATPAILARWDLPGGARECDAFFQTWAMKFGGARCASLADFSKLPSFLHVWAPAR